MSAAASRRLAWGLLAWALAGVGCQPAAFVAQVFTPPADVPAAYKLPDRPTVVFVDDREHKLPTLAVQSLLAGRIGDDFVEHRVVTQVISSSAINDLRHQHGDFDDWAIDRIGSSVGAQQVVYVLIEQFQMTDADGAHRPTAVVRVKVVDATNGQRLFPAADRFGHLGAPPRSVG